jgi:muramidase (phage lysozyme)
MRAAYVAAAVGVVAVAWWYSKEETEGGEVVAGVVEDAAQTLDEWTGGIMQLSDMAKVTGAQLRNQNVQAFLRVIRKGEGTADQGGYARLFGGGQFATFADHPRQVVTRGAYTSTAAGAYQFLTSTWDETKRVMGLSDFSPASQDLGAVGRIAARGALGDVIAGRFEAAIKKCAKEWASLPYSPYGQPVISMETAQNVYSANGGALA